LAERPDVIIYTDGACSGNPGPGGWAAILKHPVSGEVKKISGGDPNTTNNRMELKGAIEGLRTLKPNKRWRVHLVSDSQYLIHGLTQWIKGWIANDWRRGKKPNSEPVKNADLWIELHELSLRHDMTYEHVLGHAGHPENEEWDRLAVAEIGKLAPLPKRTDSLESLARADVVIHVHGTCLGSEGPGGWAAIVQSTKQREPHRISGSAAQTTSNRMELTAVMEALRTLEPTRLRVHVLSSNGYAIDGLSKWMMGWHSKGWPSKIKHTDLWRPLYDLSHLFEMSYEHVASDADDPQAEECRRMARAAVEARFRKAKTKERQ